MTLSLYTSGSIAGNARPSVGLHACPRRTVAVRRTRRLAVRAESGDKPKGPQEFALVRGLPAQPCQNRQLGLVMCSMLLCVCQ